MMAIETAALAAKEVAKEVAKEAAKETAKKATEVVGEAASELKEISDTVAAEKDAIDNKLWEAEGEAPKPLNNKLEGCRRENEVMAELESQYPESEGYKILRERELLDKDGNKVKDPITGSGRRIDIIVNKDEPIRSVEVTSLNADKTAQMAQETRIRENGGEYIKDYEGNLIKIPDNVKTEIIRRA